MNFVFKCSPCLKAFWSPIVLAASEAGSCIWMVVVESPPLRFSYKKQLRQSSVLPFFSFKRDCSKQHCIKNRITTIIFWHTFSTKFWVYSVDEVLNYRIDSGPQQLNFLFNFEHTFQRCSSSKYRGK